MESKDVGSGAGVGALIGNLSIADGEGQTKVPSFAGREVACVKPEDVKAFPHMRTNTRFIANMFAEGKPLQEKTLIGTEKVNGKGFRFVTRGIDVQLASKGVSIKDSDAFDNCRKNIGNYSEKVLALYQAACQEGKIEPGDLLVVAGEYYGPDVQLGIESPYKSNDFAAFQISVNNERTLPYEDFKSLTEASGIPSTPVVFRGTWTELMQFNPNELKSHYFSGQAEGAVFQEEHATYVDMEKTRELFVFKIKSKDFQKEERGVRNKGARRARQREESGVKKGEQVVSNELFQEINGKVTLDRIVSLLGSQSIDLSCERDEAFYNDVRKKIITNAIDEVAVDGGPEDTFSKEAREIIADDYKKGEFMVSLMRKAKKSLSVQEIESRLPQPQSP